MNTYVHAHIKNWQLGYFSPERNTFTTADLELRFPENTRLQNVDMDTLQRSSVYISEALRRSRMHGGGTERRVKDENEASRRRHKHMQSSTDPLDSDLRNYAGVGNVQNAGDYEHAQHARSQDKGGGSIAVYNVNGDKAPSAVRGKVNKSSASLFSTIRRASEDSDGTLHDEVGFDDSGDEADLVLRLDTGQRMRSNDGKVVQTHEAGVMTEDGQICDKGGTGVMMSALDPQLLGNADLHRFLKLGRNALEQGQGDAGTAAADAEYEARLKYELKRVRAAMRLTNLDNKVLRLVCALMCITAKLRSQVHQCVCVCVCVCECVCVAMCVRLFMHVNVYAYTCIHIQRGVTHACQVLPKRDLSHTYHKTYLTYIYIYIYIHNICMHTHTYIQRKVTHACCGIRRPVQAIFSFPRVVVCKVHTQSRERCKSI
jgi:hypothetical protein